MVLVDVSDVIANLRIDVGDTDATLFSDDEIKRALSRAVTRVNMDMSTAYVVDATDLTPDPSAEHLELILLAAHALLAVMRRSVSAATGIMFQSGDKKVDKTKSAASWADMANSLWEQYRRLVCKLTGSYCDDSILVPDGFSPLIYEQGSEELEEE